MMAISIAQTNCFEAKKPSYKRNKGTAWNDEGYRVDTDYYELEEPIEITKYIYNPNPKRYIGRD